MRLNELASENLRDQARQQSERGNHTAAERLWEAAQQADAALDPKPSPLGAISNLAAHARMYLNEHQYGFVLLCLDDILALTAEVFSGSPKSR